MAVITLTIDLTSGRPTVPSEPFVDSHHRHHSHHRPRCILRAPHPSETHACRSSTTPSRSLPPSALQPRLHGASHLKSPSIITASSAISRRPRVYPAPHHRLLVSSLSRASSTPRPTPVFFRSDSRTFSAHDYRQRCQDSRTLWTLRSHFIYASFISAYFK